MAIYGNKRRRGFFDPPEDWTIDESGATNAPQAGAPQEKPAGFWQGGGKFTGKDALAGILAVIGDAFANQAGMPAGAVQGLSGGRLSAIELAKKQAERQQQQQALMAAAMRRGMSADDVTLQQGGIKMPERKGLQPIVGPDGLYVWDKDNERYASPPGGAVGDDEWNNAKPIGGAELSSAPRRFRR